MDQSPPTSSGSNEMYPRVRLGEAALTIQNQERQRIIRIVALLSQQRSAEIALHGNQMKWWLTLVMLQPLCPAATEVAYAVEDNYPALDFHGPYAADPPAMKGVIFETMR